MHSSDSVAVDLLQCFFAACEKEFRFLEQEHGYRYISGLAEYRDKYQIIVPYQNQGITDDFLAMTRYEKDDKAFEILFSSDHFVLEGHVYYDPVNRFEISEILAAAKKDHKGMIGGWGLSQSDVLTQTIQSMAKNLSENIGYYLKSDERLMSRALVIRNKRIEQAVRKQFKLQVTSACKQASKAFVQKNYEHVVKLLQPLEFYLDPSDLKKLKLARKYLLS